MWAQPKHTLVCVCVCVYKEPDSPEGNISAQDCQRTGWYMVLKKNAHVCLCMYMCICLYTLVHGTSVCGTEREHMKQGLFERTWDELLIGGGAMNSGQCSKPWMFIYATELRKRCLIWVPCFKKSKQQPLWGEVDDLPHACLVSVSAFHRCPGLFQIPRQFIR